jgi:hypothetical protein
MRSLGALSFAGVLLAAAAAHACGPFFPNSYLVVPDYNPPLDVMDMPRVSFDAEITQLLGPPDTPRPQDTSENVDRYDREKKEAHQALDATSTTDVVELRETLRNDGMEIDAIEPLVKQYEVLRRTLAEVLAQEADEAATARSGYTEPPDPLPIVVDLASYESMLGNIPVEFAEYLRGAVAYHGQRYEEAVQHWTKVLALPPRDREHRTVWASYMMGQALRKQKNPSKALEYFEQTREFVKSGVSDSLGLGVQSLGWQARAEGEAGQYVAAIHHYAEFYKLEGRAETAIRSLDWVCGKIAKNANADAALAQDDLCWRVIAAWLASHPDDPAVPKRWLDVFTALHPTAPRAGADRMAWAAYGAGDIPAAAQWIELADANSPYAQWVRAKLLLRDGKIEEGTALLATLGDRGAALMSELGTASAVGPAETASGITDMRRALAEAGVLLLSQQKYADALDKFAKSSFWPDTLYLADCVLTPQELEDYTTAHAQDPELNEPEIALLYAEHPMTRLERLRYVLATRWADQGLWDKALPYFPEGLREDARTLAQELKLGKDAQRPPRERARDLIAAGQLMRTKGMELLGRELAPDWRALEGLFDGGRSKSLGNEHDPRRISDDEKHRVEQNTSHPDIRFHYRYKAADLMWEAASLLPDNDPLTAKSLYLGGVYLKSRDPGAANRFYKALVRRNPNLLIARQARKLKWFPLEYTDKVLYTPRPHAFWSKRRIAALGGIALAAIGVAGAGFAMRRKRVAATGLPEENPPPPEG